MPVVYIITNKWYRADNMYKVGRSDKDIEELLQQYPPRYMPGKELVRHWNVDDCATTELIIHTALDITTGIERVEGEWFRGDIDVIISTIDKNIDRCIKDRFILTIEYRGDRINDYTRVYPLSYLPLSKLQQLGKELGIRNPHDVSNAKWRPLQIRLLYNREKIIDAYRSGSKISESSRKIWSRLTGYPPDESLLEKLYVLVQPNIDSKEAFAIEKIIDVHTSNSSSSTEPLRRSERISSLKREGKLPYTYSDETPSSNLQHKIESKTRIQNRDYESMTVRELDALLDEIVDVGRSYIQPKSNKIRALRNPELIPSLIAEGKKAAEERRRRTKD